MYEVGEAIIPALFQPDCVRVECAGRRAHISGLKTEWNSADAVNRGINISLLSFLLNKLLPGWWFICFSSDKKCTRREEKLMTELYLQWFPTLFSSPAASCHWLGTPGRCPPQQRGSSPVHKIDNPYNSIKYIKKKYSEWINMKLNSHNLCHIYLLGPLILSPSSHPDLLVDHSVLGILVKFFLRIYVNPIGSQLFPDLARACSKTKRTEILNPLRFQTDRN